VSYSRHRARLALPTLVAAPLPVFALTGYALATPHGQRDGPRQKGEDHPAAHIDR